MFWHKDMFSKTIIMNKNILAVFALLMVGVTAIANNKTGDVNRDGSVDVADISKGSHPLEKTPSSSQTLWR